MTSKKQPRKWADLTPEQKSEIRRQREAKTCTILARITNAPDCTMIDAHTVAALLGRGCTSVWRDVKNEIIPQPTRLGRSTRWRLGDIKSHLAKIGV